MFEIYNNQNIIIVIDNENIVDDYSNFSLKIKNYDFYGEHSFCVNLGNIKLLVKQLTAFYSLNEQHCNEIELIDYDSESRLCFNLCNGKILLCGQLGSSYEDNLWTFKFEVDQTIIGRLINALNELIHC